MCMVFGDIKATFGNQILGDSSLVPTSRGKSAFGKCKPLMIWASENPQFLGQHQLLWFG